MPHLPSCLWTFCAALVGFPAVSSAVGSPSANPPFRVVTYNVQEGGALRGTQERLRALEEKILPDVDVLGVQELCAGEGGWQVRALEQRMKAVAGTVHLAMARADPTSGPGCERVQALFTPHPILGSGALTLPRMRQGRSALWADLLVPTPDAPEGRLLRVYNTHLENRTGPLPGGEQARAIQMRVVLKHLQAWQADHPGAPVVVLGDLNSSGSIWNVWHREAAIQELEAAQLRPSTLERVRTLTFLPHQVDWIFSRGLTRVTSHALRVYLSDHFPLVADYHFPPLDPPLFQR